MKTFMQGWTGFEAGGKGFKRSGSRPARRGQQQVHVHLAPPVPWVLSKHPEPLSLRPLVLAHHVEGQPELYPRCRVSRVLAHGLLEHLYGAIEVLKVPVDHAEAGLEVHELGPEAQRLPVLLYGLGVEAEVFIDSAEVRVHVGELAFYKRVQVRMRAGPPLLRDPVRLERLLDPAGV